MKVCEHCHKFIFDSNQHDCGVVGDKPPKGWEFVKEIEERLLAKETELDQARATMLVNWGPDQTRNEPLLTGKDSLTKMITVVFDSIANGDNCEVLK